MNSPPVNHLPPGESRADRKCQYCGWPFMADWLLRFSTAWNQRAHERKCKDRTPEQRAQWKAKHLHINSRP